MDKGDRLEPGCHGRDSKRRAGPRAQQEEMKPASQGREGKGKEKATLMFSSQSEVHPPAFWQLEWRRGRQNQKGLEALTPKRRPRGFHLSQVTSTGRPSLPGSPRAGFLCMGRGRGDTEAATPGPSEGRGWGPGERRRLDIHDFVTRRPGLARGWAGKEMHAGDFQGKGQDPKPRNSRNNTSQSGDAGGWGGTTRPARPFRGRQVGEGPDGGEGSLLRPRSSLRRSRWGMQVGAPGHSKQRLQSLKQWRDGGVTWTHSLLSRPRSLHLAGGERF